MMCEIYSLKNNLFVARHQRRAAIQSHHAHRNAHAATQPVSHNPSGIRKKKKKKAMKERRAAESLEMHTLAATPSVRLQQLGHTITSASQGFCNK